jgi:hypothetical protein
MLTNGLTTARLGETLHAYAITLARQQRGEVSEFHVHQRYAPLFINSPLLIKPCATTHWNISHSRFLGPKHAENVRDTLATAAGLRAISTEAHLEWWKTKSGMNRHVLLCPHGSRRFKEWDPNKWFDVAQWLVDKDIKVLVAGDPNLKAMPMPPEVDCKPLGIVGLAQAIASASVVISVDSGQVHLADMINVPVIGLYGATSALTYGPYRDSSLCIDRHLMAWREHGESKYSTVDHLPAAAMNLIQARDVIERIRSLTFSLH